MTKYILLFIILVSFNKSFSQSYISGKSYYGKDSFIEYQPGNLPVILSVPHGGYLVPDSIPDRLCEGCAYVSDAYTQELGREIREFFYSKTGCLPHLITNLLHRRKLDMNRNLIFATDSNPKLDTFWKDYHNFIDNAKKTILQNYGKGLFLDLHGHGHTKQRIELGYLLFDSELRESDSMLNTAQRIKISAIRNLANNSISKSFHAELIRGEYALGSFLEDKGYPSVPSIKDPYPLIDDPYFNGGYNTLNHGSNPGGTIDAIQLELYSAIRFNSSLRKKFAENFTEILQSYIDKHYFIDFKLKKCNENSISNSFSNKNYIIFQNATHIILKILAPSYENNKLEIFNIFGQKIDTRNIYNQEMIIEKTNYSKGFYLFKINDGNHFFIDKICLD